MSNKILTVKFFDRPTLKVARELLGKFLVRRIGKKEISGMITEVEAYIGREDKASHASRGITERTKVMFGKSGYWYIYLIYGMYHCLNIVTEKESYPAAILIRGVKSKGKLIEGPGRVCRHFMITRNFNAKIACVSTGLWMENRRVKINHHTIQHGKRLGIEYAGKWKNKLWRFILIPVQRT